MQEAAQNRDDPRTTELTLRAAIDPLLQLPRVIEGTSPSWRIMLHWRGPFPAASGNTCFKKGTY
jgi:hypothetical protein